ncbi:MAG: hypothetical protein Fues2KO_17240 [Fuerstiella sp.]
MAQHVGRAVEWAATASRTDSPSVVTAVGQQSAWMAQQSAFLMQQSGLETVSVGVFNESALKEAPTKTNEVIT